MRLVLIALIALAVSTSSTQRSFAQKAPAKPTLKQKKKQAAFHTKQANAHLRAKRYPQAIVEMKRAYELEPKSKLLFNIGLAYAYLSDHDNAIDYFDRYIAAEPNGKGVPQARQQLEQLRAARAKLSTEKAASALRESRAQLAAKQYSEAVASLQRSYALSGDHERLYDIAEAYRQAQDTEQALLHYKKYREASPDGPRSVEAQEKITTLGQAQPTDVAVTATAAGQSSQDKQPGLWRNKWVRIGAGVALLAGGIVADTVPERNGSFDALDLLPVGLYGAGGALVFVGVF